MKRAIPALLIAFLTPIRVDAACDVKQATPVAEQVAKDVNTLAFHIDLMHGCKGRRPLRNYLPLHLADTTRAENASFGDDLGVRRTPHPRGGTG
jgi:hypothetical protein